MRMTWTSPIGSTSMSAQRTAGQSPIAAGTLALVGGGEWNEGCTGFDQELLATSGGTEVVVIPAAAAYEYPDKVVERAVAYFAALGATVRPLMVLSRRDAQDAEMVGVVAASRFVYLADGSPMHLRSVLKGSALVDALFKVCGAGGVVAASGAGATVLCDPMVDPRGGAYTVGLGMVENLAVFPYHGTAAAHLLDRSVELLPATATLVGIEDQTALVHAPNGTWTVKGVGTVSVYRGGDPEIVVSGNSLTL